MAWRRILLLSLVVLAACARREPPAPYELHMPGGPPILSQPAGPHPDRVTVASGETLYGIARRYGLPMRAIIDVNHLQPPYHLIAGASLALPQLRTYRVAPGDTLATVARRNGVDMSTLAATNRLAAPYVIRSGELLVLPAPVETGAAPAPPKETASQPAAAVVATASLPPPTEPPTPFKPPPPPPVIAKKTEPVASPPAVAAAPQPPESPVAPAKAPESAPGPVPETTASAERPAKPEPPPGGLAALPPFPVPGTGFLWPVRGRVISAFGAGAEGTHNDGINIAAAEGTPVLAAAAGDVAYAGNELKGYGNLILIKHPDGYVTAYAHNAALLVKRGDKVARGQPIARVGATGAVTEPQLHFEIRRGTRALDPIELLPAEAAAK